MYNVTGKYKNQVKKLPQNYRMEIEVIFDVSTEGISLKTENGEILTTEIGDVLEFPAPGSIHIPADDIFDSGFAECVFLSSFAVGTSVRPNWWVRINNKDGKYKNNAFASAEFHPRVMLYDDDGNITDTVPIGIYFTDKITIQGSDLHIACFDKMAYTEKLFIPTGTERTLYEIAIGIALDVRSVLINTPQDLPILSLVVNDTIFSGYSKKQVLELIACVSGSFVQFDNDGNLVFKWFTHSGVELNGDNAKSPLSLNGNTFSLDGNPVKVTGVSVVYEDSELARIGTDDYLLTVNENPIAALYPDEVAEFILNRLKDTLYIPCEWNRIGGDPALQLGDIVTIIDNKEPYNPEYYDKYNKYPLYMTSRSWRYNCGGFSDVYKASGNAEKDLNTDKGMTLSKRTSKLAKRITETKKDLTEDMDKRQEFLLLFNETVAASMGFYSTAVEDDSGAVVQYMHDKPELTESKTIYTKGINGFAWTNDGWNNGNPVWQYGFDKNGNAILNQIYAYNLTADVIVSGLLKSKNGASWINLDDGTFSFGKKVMLGLFTMPVLSLDDEGYLSMFGKLCSAWDKDRKFGFMNNGIGLTYGSTDVFNIDSFKVGNNRKVEFKAPFTRNASNLYGKQLILSDNYASLEAFHTTSINVKSACLKLNASSDGQTFDLYAKTGVDYGIRSDPTWGIIIYVGSHQAYLGNSGTFYVEAFDFISDREKKENICEIRPDALEDLCKLRFYSYNIKDGGPTVKMGVMADEVPDIIAGENKKSVSSYPFSCFIARALQQLADKVDALEKRVEALEKENQILKEENL